MSDPITVTIHNHRYDITDFVPNHPGEKKGVNLLDYNGLDISTDFETAHMKPKRKTKVDLLLDQAKKDGICNGVKYLGSINQSSSELKET